MSKDIICRRCGEGGLHWVARGIGWILFKDNIQHLCKVDVNIEPCPFCKSIGEWTIDGRVNVVQCKSCGAQGPVAYGSPNAVRNTAIERWNTRK